MLKGAFLWINKKFQFEKELIARKTADPEIALNLNADDAVQYGTVAKVMAAIERSGITKLAVLTAPKT